jgi:hypothetical protein
MSVRPLSTEPLQLDLFGDALSAERQRLSDALVCLRDSVPTALEVVAWLRYGDTHDTRDAHLGGGWAYCVCAAGLRFETEHAWGTGARERGERYGFSRTPDRLVTWVELTALFGDDPRRSEIAVWADSLPLPRWKQLMRPHELWPNPESWHPSYITNDHKDPHWPGRWHAWGLVLAVLNDAIERVTTLEATQ